MIIFDTGKIDMIRGMHHSCLVLMRDTGKIKKEEL
jgi:hypothetical protein